VTSSTDRSPPKVLFVGHAASRSGAPILLLQFLRWLKANSDLRFDAIVVADGPLLDEMRAVAPTAVLEKWPSLPERAVRKLAGAERWSKWQDQRFQRGIAKGGYDLAYVNTVVPGREIGLISELGIPVVCHVHELDFAMMQMVGEPGIRRLIPRVTHFIAASNAVGDYLRERWAIPEAKVSVIHEFTSAPSAPDNGELRRRTRAELGVSDAEVLVGSCGTLDWRKGADLFLQVARLVSAQGVSPAIKFVWVGANPSHPDTQRFLHDVRAAGLEQSVHVIPAVAEPNRYYQAMDVFALTSREDPFPLVMLEAATAGLPVVCFAGSGGGPEFVEGDAGLAAPYLDVDAFTQHVVALASDANARRVLGAAGNRKVYDRYTIAVQAPKLRDVIWRFSRQG
jgi:glycosyltransferase involved in cell wall biosynthesis